MRFLPLLLMLSCAGMPTVYTTTCGLEFRGEVSTGVLGTLNAEEVQFLETTAISLGLVNCEQLRGYGIYTHPTKWREWNDPEGFYRSGSAFCNNVLPRIEVDQRYPAVILHEVHHIAQGCWSPFPIDQGEDETHADWTRTGARKAIEQGTILFTEKYGDKARACNYVKPHPDGGCL